MGYALALASSDLDFVSHSTCGVVTSDLRVGQA